MMYDVCYEYLYMYTLSLGIQNLDLGVRAHFRAQVGKGGGLGREILDPKKTFKTCWNVLERTANV